jgi:UPF0755 protein
MSHIQKENQQLRRYFENKNQARNQSKQQRNRTISGWIALGITALFFIWQIGYLIFRYGFDFKYKNDYLPYELNAAILLFSALSIVLFSLKKKTWVASLLTIALLFSVNTAFGIIQKNEKTSAEKKANIQKQNNEKAASDKKEIDKTEDQDTTTVPNESTIPNPDTSETPGTIPTPGATPGTGTTPSPGPQTPPPPVAVTISIPEGFTFKQIAERLEANGVTTVAAFYAVAQNYRVQSFTIPSSPNRAFNLEGYLFPDTYKFNKNDDPTAIIKKMLNNYASKSGKPADETIILASIIEKEARSTENMKLVAGVFKNRMALGMRLEADSTREYVNKNITGYALLGDTAKFAALYSTYKCPALPAGPISNPSARAIQAALNPTPSEYLYFFFGNDNQNHYSTTLEEHNALKKQFGVKFAN